MTARSPTSARSSASIPTAPRWFRTVALPGLQKAGLRPRDRRLRSGAPARSAQRAGADAARQSYRLKGDYDRAITDFDEAMKIDPRYVARLSGTSHRLGRQDRDDRAITDYSEAIRIDGRNANLFRPGARLCEQRDYDRAIADYDQALTLNPAMRSPWCAAPRPTAARANRIGLSPNTTRRSASTPNTSRL